MIVSYSRNFIFIKTRKTAGTSIEIALSKFCKEQDVVTPISPDDEITRRKLGGTLPQNFSNSPTFEIAYRHAIESGDIHSIDTSRREADTQKIFWNHMPALSVRQTISDQFWRDAYKFTIDRHPYEKVISQAYFRFERRYPRNNNFHDLLHNVVMEGRYRNLDLYCYNGVPIVDAILKYEELPDCLRDISDLVGSDISLGLPRTKHQFRHDHRPAREILTKEQKRVVFSRCKMEFDLLGYEK